MKSMFLILVLIACTFWVSSTDHGDKNDDDDEVLKHFIKRSLHSKNVEEQENRYIDHGDHSGVSVEKSFTLAERTSRAKMTFGFIFVIFGLVVAFLLLYSLFGKRVYQRYKRLGSTVDKVLDRELERINDRFPKNKSTDYDEVSMERIVEDQPDNEEVLPQDPSNFEDMEGVGDLQRPSSQSSLHPSMRSQLSMNDEAVKNVVPQKSIESCIGRELDELEAVSKECLDHVQKELIQAENERKNSSQMFDQPKTPPPLPPRINRPQLMDSTTYSEASHPPPVGFFVSTRSPSQTVKEPIGFEGIETSITTPLNRSVKTKVAPLPPTVTSLPARRSVKHRQAPPPPRTLPTQPEGLVKQSPKAYRAPSPPSLEVMNNFERTLPTPNATIHDIPIAPPPPPILESASHRVPTSQIGQKAKPTSKPEEHGEGPLKPMLSPKSKASPKSKPPPPPPPVLTATDGKTKSPLNSKASGDTKEKTKTPTAHTNAEVPPAPPPPPIKSPPKAKSSKREAPVPLPPSRPNIPIAPPAPPILPPAKGVTKRITPIASTVNNSTGRKSFSPSKATKAGIPTAPPPPPILNKAKLKSTSSPKIPTAPPPPPIHKTKPTSKPIKPGVPTQAQFTDHIDNRPRSSTTPTQSKVPPAPPPPPVLTNNKLKTTSKPGLPKAPPPPPPPPIIASVGPKSNSSSRPSKPNSPVKLLKPGIPTAPPPPPILGMKSPVKPTKQGASIPPTTLTLKSSPKSSKPAGKSQPVMKSPTKELPSVPKAPPPPPLPGSKPQKSPLKMLTSTVSKAHLPPSLSKAASMKPKTAPTSKLSPKIPIAPPPPPLPKAAAIKPKSAPNSKLSPKIPAAPAPPLLPGKGQSKPKTAPTSKLSPKIPVAPPTLKAASMKPKTAPTSKLLPKIPMAPQPPPLPKAAAIKPRSAPNSKLSPKIPVVPASPLLSKKGQSKPKTAPTSKLSPKIPVAPPPPPLPKATTMKPLSAPNSKLSPKIPLQSKKGQSKPVMKSPTSKLSPKIPIAPPPPPLTKVAAMKPKSAQTSKLSPKIPMPPLTKADAMKSKLVPTSKLSPKIPVAPPPPPLSKKGQIISSSPSKGGRPPKIDHNTLLAEKIKSPNLKSPASQKQTGNKKQEKMTDMLQGVKLKKSNIVKPKTGVLKTSLQSRRLRISSSSRIPSTDSWD